MDSSGLGPSVNGASGFDTLFRDSEVPRTYRSVLTIKLSRWCSNTEGILREHSTMVNNNDRLKSAVSSPYYDSFTWSITCIGAQFCLL